jgi:uncharacterized repeat protein (TIGR03806 family)
MDNKSWKRVVLALAMVALAGANANADDFICRWANGPITIDGHRNEADWQQATVIDSFTIPASNGKKPTTTSRARLLWDRQYLYFFADLEDHDLFADVVERDGKTWDNDVFELFFKPSEKSEGYYEFQVNAAGTEMDLYLPDQRSGGYDKLRSSHPFDMKSQVVRRGTLTERNDRDEGWTVEGRIAWIDFMPTGGRPDIDEVWKIALCRYDYTLGSKPELSSCAPLTQFNFHRVQDYAALRFAGPAESNLMVNKMAARRSHLNSKVVGRPDPPLPYQAVRAYPHLRPEWPVDVKVEPGSRRLIIIEEKSAYSPTMIRRTKDDPSNGEMELLIDPQGVAYSVCFHPKFLENGYVYIGSNGKCDGEEHKSRVVRYTLARKPPFEVLGDPLTIIEWDSNGHNGAAITFGLDGMMYVTSGDGTSDSDANVTGQDLTKLLAKVLRIDVDHPSDGLSYSIPSDNPFVGQASVRPETWAYGLRNPWRMTTDPKSGHIWVGNNGQDMYEQAYLIERGANYGWSVFEGSHPFYPQRQLGPTPHTKPTVEHPHSEARSLTGGVVYYGNKLPELVGAYVYADYSTGKIWGVKHDGTKILWHQEIADTAFQISAVTLDADGELLVVDHRGDGQGGLYHLEPTPTVTESNTFPRRLSQTGLFQSVAGHQVAEGVIPYTVAAPFWSDGAIKSRFIAVPEGGEIEMKDQWAWQLPEHSVLVKSFQLEMNANDPDSRKWIETRLMVKEQGEWVGYSYEWNDDQTDALLVESAGRDKSFAIKTESGSKMQSWRYPSRTECMVCHTRAAGFVLGVTTVQMNTTNDYGEGIHMNQLEALEAMGLLKTDWIAKAKEVLQNELSAAGLSKESIDTRLASAQAGDGQRKPSSNRLLGCAASVYPKLVDPHDASADLTQRARAFLHSNCAYCHVEAGGGNAKMDLSIYARTDRMNIIDIKPTHHTFDKPDARLIAPGSVDRSVLLHRIGIRGPGQMPQLATTIVDQRSLEMLKRWVAEMR